MSTAGKVIKCKAAVAWEPNKPLSIEDIEVAPPKAHEVRIKIISSGVCGTDNSVLHGRMLSPFPVILGHEGMGKVESIGEGVTIVKPGDIVIPLIVPECGKCRACITPNTNVCAKTDFGTGKLAGLMEDGTSRFTCKGKLIHNFTGTSTFSEYTVVSDIRIAKVDANAPIEACLIGCGFGTGYGGAVNAAKVTKGSSCAVFGLGGVGFSAIAGCKDSGASRIIGVGSHKDKFPNAIAMGATECICTKDHDKPIHEVICEMTNGGVDFSIECAGRIPTMYWGSFTLASKLCDERMNAIQSTYPCNGVTVLLGVASPTDILALQPGLLLSGRTVKGSVYGGYTGDGITKLVQDYMCKKFNLENFISGRIKLPEINEAFDKLNKGIGIRSIIIY